MILLSIINCHDKVEIEVRIASTSAGISLMVLTHMLHFQFTRLKQCLTIQYTYWMVSYMAYILTFFFTQMCNNAATMYLLILIFPATPPREKAVV